MSAGQRVMLKVLCVEEGMMEICADSKWKCFGENGKAQNAQGPMASVLKSVPPVDNAHIELKSDHHMVLPYRPYMKHIHPRANSSSMAAFVVEGSMLHYLPCTSEFEIDQSSTVEYSQDSRHQLFFKLDESGEAISNSLWFCTSLQSAKIEQLLRCEEVGTNVTEDIPVQRLCYAMRKDDSKAISPYDMPSKPALAAQAHSAQHAASKTAQKKHGKMDANIHTTYGTSVGGHM